ncbi:hypothetical protein J437_LFUL005172 [Ladona fulva]|uniref:NADH dehydrogenase [ubiquinone] 1 alpha subcomplex assembly factor 2 n=1 Tax=Ladona fulva TaxID=123851 RepID=A0A8K0P5V3_LADFU|nr:hypothetical protein J437_LFUL005172 [Ladona fulva]
MCSECHCSKVSFAIELNLQFLTIYLLSGVMAGQRSIIGMIFKNFIQSFKPRQTKGNYTGTDYFGNKYYEIPADPSVGKRKSSRWFEPKETDAFDQEIPAEWEAWLRGRRKDPPSEEELLKNLAVMEMKKKNAQRIAEEQTGFKSVESGLQQTRKAEFPTYEEYEYTPGQKPQKKK